MLSAAQEAFVDFEFQFSPECIERVGVLVYVHMFRGWTLTCHSLLLRLVLFIFSLATFCVYVYVFLFFPFSSFSFSSFCCSVFGLIRLSPPVTHQGGDTPLYYAISKGRMDMAVLLLEKGADLNAKDEVSPHAPIC